MTHAGFCSVSARPTHAMGMRKEAATTRVESRREQGEGEQFLVGLEHLPRGPGQLHGSGDASHGGSVCGRRPARGLQGSPPVACGPGMNDPFAPDPCFQPLRHRAPRWPFVLVGVFLLIGAAVLALWPVKVPYFAIAPGPGGGGRRPHLGGGRAGLRHQRRPLPAHGGTARGERLRVRRGRARPPGGPRGARRRSGRRGSPRSSRPAPTCRPWTSRSTPPSTWR